MRVVASAAGEGFVPSFLPLSSIPSLPRFLKVRYEKKKRLYIYIYRMCVLLTLGGGKRPLNVTLGNARINSHINENEKEAFLHRLRFFGENSGG